MANGISHDQNFKNLSVDYPRQSISFFAAKEAPDSSDNVRIFPARQELLQEHLGDRYRELDVPLLVEWEDNRREAVVFMLEEETDPSHFSIHRLAHYCLDLAKLLKTPRIVPVVIFLNPADSIPRSLSLRTERDWYLLFKYQYCQLSAIPFEIWEHSDNLVARLNLPNMYKRDDQKVRAYGQAVRGLMTLEPDPRKREKYIDFIDIYAGLTDNEREQYRRSCASLRPRQSLPREQRECFGHTVRPEHKREYPEEYATMTGFAERFREEGRQQGMQQGMQQGWRSGERALLERQLRRRFGLLTPEVSRSLEEASIDKLERWADKVLEARSLEEIFNE